MIYSEEALNQLSSVCQELNCNYDIVSQTEKGVKINVTNLGHEFQVWFDVDKQNYYFNLVSGGTKACTSFNEFKEFFKVYFTICVSIVPDSKAIVDAFESIIDCNTIYDNFVSDMKSDKVVVLFKVLGKADLVIHVTKYFYDRMYTVSLKESCEGGTKLKTLKEYLYEMDDTNHPVLIPNVYSYMDRLHALYDTSDDVNIQRYSSSGFSVNYNGDSMIYEVDFVNDIQFSVVGFNGRSLSPAISLTVTDVYNIEEMFEAFKMVYEMIETDTSVEMSANNDDFDDFDFDDTAENEASEDGYLEEGDYSEDYSENEDESGIDDTDFSEDTALSSSEENDSYEDFEDESYIDSEEVSAEITEEEDWNESFNDTSEEEETTMDEQLEGYIEIRIMLITECGENKAVRFIDSDKLYDMSIEKALSLGIPVSRICDTEERRNIRGIFMTDSEKHSRIFAEDITDNDELCASLVDRLFE